MIGVTDRDGYAERARLILDDLQRFTPDQVFGQNVPSLYFIAEADGRPSLGDLQGLMKKYPQFGMGWPESAAEYRQQMTTAGEKRYTKRRARCLKYWFDQAGGDLDWLYSSAQQNYTQAFQWLRDNRPRLAEWYYDKPSDTTGMIWHLTDINNVANILSHREITSKNDGLANGIIENDNVASVNDSAAKPWVDDFARFSLRPKTPAQYCIEGIYQYYGDQPDFSKLPTPLVNQNHDGFWTAGKPAHLPVPVFIGFSLKEFLQRGGHLTKGPLAGKQVADRPEEMYDDDFAFLRDNVADIYSDRQAPSRLKATEFIIPKKMEFKVEDVLRIVVRSEAEKLVLLTMLTEYGNREAHQAVDPQEYIDQIVVARDFFYSSGSTVQVGAGMDVRNQYHLHLQPAIAAENLKRTEKGFGYEKTINGSEVRVSVPELKQVTIKVRDVNGEEKTVARFHDPDWILDVSKRVPSEHEREESEARGRVLKNRYYSTLYYGGQYYKLWREEGADEWYLVGSKQPADILAPADREILKKAEESFREEPQGEGGSEKAPSLFPKARIVVPKTKTPAKPQPTIPPKSSDDGDDDDDFLILF